MNIENILNKMENYEYDKNEYRRFDYDINYIDNIWKNNSNNIIQSYNINNRFSKEQNNYVEKYDKRFENIYTDNFKKENKYIKNYMKNGEVIKIPKIKFCKYGIEFIDGVNEFCIIRELVNEDSRIPLLLSVNFEKSDIEKEKYVENKLCRPFSSLCNCIREDLLEYDFDKDNRNLYYSMNRIYNIDNLRFEAVLIMKYIFNDNDFSNIDNSFKEKLMLSIKK